MKFLTKVQCLSHTWPQQFHSSCAWSSSYFSNRVVSVSCGNYLAVVRNWVCHWNTKLSYTSETVSGLPVTSFRDCLLYRLRSVGCSTNTNGFCFCWCWCWCGWEEELESSRLRRKRYMMSFTGSCLGSLSSWMSIWQLAVETKANKRVSVL